MLRTRARATDNPHSAAIAAVIKRTPLQRAWGIASSVLWIFAAALAVALGVVPLVVGGTTLTIMSDSMRPTFAAGDAIVIRHVGTADACGVVQVGDIVTFMARPNDPTTITHRVVAVEPTPHSEDETNCRITTQGDNNKDSDVPISPLAVRGIYMFHVPWVGHARAWVANNLIIAAVIAGVLIVGSALMPRRRVVLIESDENTPNQETASTNAPEGSKP